MYNALSVDSKHNNIQRNYSRVLSAPIFSLYDRVLQRRMTHEEKSEVVNAYFSKNNFYFKFSNVKMLNLLVCQSNQNLMWVRFGRWLIISTKPQYTF